MNVPQGTDRVVKVGAYMTDEVFGYDHWRAAQFSAPRPTRPALLLIFDTEAERNAAYDRAGSASPRDSERSVTTVERWRVEAALLDVDRALSALRTALASDGAREGGSGTGVPTSSAASGGTLAQLPHEPSVDSLGSQPERLDGSIPSPPSAPHAAPPSKEGK